MKKLEFKEMEIISGGEDRNAFLFMCGGMAAVLGTLTFGLGLLAGVACWTLTVD